MPVNVVVVGKKNPQSPGDPEKYYSQTKSNGDVDLRQLSTQIADVSTVKMSVNDSSFAKHCSYADSKSPGPKARCTSIAQQITRFDSSSNSTSCPS